MWIELETLQREVGITFVYVTHDQEEALTVSGRMAVMHPGKVLQIGSPNRASSEFVDARILEELAIYPPPETMEKLEFLRDVGEATAIYDCMRTEIKSQ